MYPMREKRNINNRRNATFHFCNNKNINNKSIFNIMIEKEKRFILMHVTVEKMKKKMYYV